MLLYCYGAADRELIGNGLATSASQNSFILSRSDDGRFFFVNLFRYDNSARDDNANGVIYIREALSDMCESYFLIA
jgi:hypothetical protein